MSKKTCMFNFFNEKLILNTTKFKVLFGIVVTIDF